MEIKYSAADICNGSHIWDGDYAAGNKRMTQDVECPECFHFFDVDIDTDEPIIRAKECRRCGLEALSDGDDLYIKA